MTRHHIKHLPRHLEKVELKIAGLEIQTLGNFAVLSVTLVV